MKTRGGGAGAEEVVVAGKLEDVTLGAMDDESKIGRVEDDMVIEQEDMMPDGTTLPDGNTPDGIMLPEGNTPEGMMLPEGIRQCPRDLLAAVLYQKVKWCTNNLSQKTGTKASI